MQSRTRPRALIPTTRALVSGENPSRQVLLSQLLLLQEWPRASRRHTLGAAVRWAMTYLKLPWDDLLSLQPSADSTSARTAASSWRRRALRAAGMRQALEVLGDAALLGRGNTARHILSCASGVRDDDGTVVEAVLVVAPLQYVRTPFCREAARLRLLLRNNALPTRAFQQRYGGSAHAAICPHCPLNAPGTAMHYLRECSAVEVSLPREQAWADFFDALHSSAIPATRVTSLFWLLSRGLRGSCDLLQFLSGVIPAWWPSGIQDVFGDVVARTGNPHTVAGYYLRPDRTVGHVRVRLLAPWVDRLSLRLLLSLCRSIEFWSAPPGD